MEGICLRCFRWKVLKARLLCGSCYAYVRKDRYKDRMRKERVKLFANTHKIKRRKADAYGRRNKVANYDMAIIRNCLKHIDVGDYHKVYEVIDKPKWKIEACVHGKRYAKGMCRTCYERDYYHRHGAARERRNRYARLHRVYARHAGIYVRCSSPGCKRHHPKGLNYLTEARSAMRRLDAGGQDRVKNALRAKARKAGFAASMEGAAKAGR